MKGETEKDLTKLLHEQGFTFEDVNLESTFKEDLKLDSLDTVDFLMQVEEKFNITIPANDSEKIYTVGELVNYINDRIESRKFA